MTLRDGGTVPEASGNLDAAAHQLAGNSIRPGRLRR
jgi:hypothetical protein